MTKSLRFVLAICLATTLHFTATSQSLSINTTATPADASAILDVSSTLKGVLIPRMDKTAKGLIATPANGLLVYQTGPDSIGFHYYDLLNTKWVYINASGFSTDTTAWKLTGNSNVADTSFLGSKNNKALRFKVYDTTAGIVDSTSGNAALGYKALRNNTAAGFYANSAVGFGAGQNLSSGYGNAMMGRHALSLTGASIQNVAIGDSAMGSAVSSAGNTAIGYQALKQYNGLGFYTYNTAIGFASQSAATGTINGPFSYYNTSVGGYAMANNVAGYDNVAIGISALRYNDSSASNTAIGTNAMAYHKRSGFNSNVALGSFAMQGDSTGFWNTAVGSEAMDRYSLDGTAKGSGFSNVAVGFRALRGVRQGYENTAVGVGALESDSSGNYNTAVGRYASFLNKRGNFNVSLGFSASSNADTVSNTVAIGSYAGAKNKQNNNVTIGYAAGYEAGSSSTYNPKEITFVGYEAGRGSWASNKNTALGFRALSNTDAGFGIYDYLTGRNTAIGDSAMAFSIGGSNVVVGTEALSNTGIPGVWNNVAIGDSAMGAAQSNSGALADNVAIGYKSLTRIKNQGNIAIGAYAGNELANSIWNTAVGYHALETDTTGSENTVVGTSAFRSSGNGTQNVSLGINTGYWVTSSYNTYLGSYAGQGFYNRSTGASNTGVGDYALFLIRSGAQNVAIGESALSSDSTGSTNVSIGAGSMESHLRGNENVAVGFWAGRQDTTATGAVYIGKEAGYNNHRDYTVAIGYQALYNNSLGVAVAADGTNNTAVGKQALFGNTLGQLNTALGYESLKGNTTGNYNTAVGYRALSAPNTSFNTAVGTNSLQSATGSSNTALGSVVMQGAVTGSNNVGIGPFALNGATGADNNIAIGNSALTTNSIGDNNTAVGISAGDANTTGSNNTLLGYNADVTVNSLTNATAIGANATVSQSDALILGSTAVDVGIGLTAPLTKFHIYEPTATNVNLRIAGSSLSSIWEPGLELVKTTASGSDWKIRVTSGGSLVYSRGADDFATTPTDYYQMSTASFIPVNDASNTLGGAGNRWTTVYATVGAINTSDARDKENIENLNYGIKDIMKLRPVSFTWKENPQWGKKIGFIAQEVQPVLNEVVQVGNLKTKADAKDDNGKTLNAGSDKLGIYYSDIIPVTVKAIQEQQQTIENQQKQIEDLKKKNEQLEKDMLLIKTKLGINN
ncbi:MAG: tail fiber domain-containing protein [Ferruginibacter sp.]